ncbi:MAG TPA: hypothetical protein DC042_10850, partial [Bacteroidales bacterium]|nr:hypothetical protein [Bacteroidales bacterium]
MGGWAFAQTATTFGDKVWHDTDADGIQDGGEIGLSGVTVELYSVGPTVLLTTTATDGSGNYSFTRTVTGSQFFRVKWITPGGYFISSANQGGSDALDSDANITTADFTFQIVEGVATTNHDCGMYQKGTLHGHLYQDSNNDGDQDVGEPDMNLVEIAITDKNAFTTTVYTNASGDWTAQIVPGTSTYDIVEATSAFFDNGYFHSEGAGLFVNLVTDGGNTNAGNDGFYLYAKIGDFVWRDYDIDGIQDPGEPGLAGVEVYLIKDDFSVFTSVFSDVNGYYEHTNIVPGTYTVNLLGVPAGYQLSAHDQGGDDNADSDINTGTMSTASFAILSGTTTTNVDIGLHQHGSISNLVWWDVDDDGVQDAGEPGVSGVTVTLYQSDGTTLVTSDVTDANGEYSFTFVEPGTYVVGFAPIAGYGIGQQDLGGDDSKDSDAHSVTGKTTSIIVGEGDHDVTIDCALVGTGQIGEGLVWEDTEGNDVQDGVEPGISGATVELLSVPAGTVLKTTLTDLNGKYKFDKLAPGDYNVKFTKPAGFDEFSTKDQGGNDALDSDGDGADAGKTGSFTLAAGATDDSRDCGFYKNVTISGKVWHDLDADGRYDGGESGENGVTVRLMNFDGSSELATTTSAGDGDWTFTGKKPGDYRVKFDKSTGSHFYSPKDVGPGDTDDSDCDTDADANPGQTDQFSCNSGSTKNDLKCGQFLKASIGDYVWTDTDLDGVQDGGETGLFSVTVKLYASDGITLVDTDITDGTGAYGFTGVMPGASYIVQFDKPSGYGITLKDQGSDATDSDGDPGTTRTILIPLTSGQTDNTWDCGMYAIGSISDLVWVDTDGDGIQDGGESGLDGVTVKLYASDGTTLLNTTLTAGGGLYLFDDLAPATYVVEFTPLGLHVITLQNQLLDDNADSDAHPVSGKTAGIVVA